MSLLAREVTQFLGQTPNQILCSSCDMPEQPRNIHIVMLIGRSLLLVLLPVFSLGAYKTEFYNVLT